MFSVKNANQTILSKYKPCFIRDFCIDDHLRGVIETLMEIDDLNILLVGNPSSGKTSMLYALIREYYGLSKDQSFPETNLLFINNLKEQGINYYRTEMKTFCQSRSSIYGKKKMIIVDDLDTINEQSQQVFRNYIDKYKNNVHFVSTCSNPQKVIESIQSRIYIVQIYPPTDEQIRGVMNRVVQEEQLSIQPDAQDYLLSFSKQSIRELLNYLEKIYIIGYTTRLLDDEGLDGVNRTPLTLDMCKTICSSISIKQFEQYIELLKTRQPIVATQLFYEIYDYGYSVIDILDYFYGFVKHTALLEESKKYRIIEILSKYITIFHNNHEDVVELALFTNELSKIV
jgi:DNA polymerase III gamma/tau subunit